MFRALPVANRQGTPPAGRQAGVARRRAALVLALGAVSWHCGRPQDSTPAALADLVPGFAYASWFTEQTGYGTDPESFGAYAIQPIGRTLYLGFGADRPTWRDGALVAAYEDGTLRAIGALSEQGMMEMTAAGETLLIPGADPCCPDEWEFGNFYTFRPRVGLTKRRNLPNVIHAFGVWYDAPDDAIYVTTGSHLGDFVTWSGEIWRSRNNAATWTRIANLDNGVGAFRTFDILRHRGRLYATRTDAHIPCELVTEPATGSTWTVVPSGRDLACFHRPVSFGAEFLVLRDSLDEVVAVSAPDTARPIALPFTVASVSVTWAAVAGQHLYALADDGRIVVTRDLVTWETIVASGRRFMTLQYWPEYDLLIVAERGGAGRVLTLQLCGGGPC